MDKIDKQILNKIQTDFPVAERPYKVIAEEFGLTEEAVISCVKKLKESGIIRRLGATFDSRRLRIYQHTRLCKGAGGED